jgi:hypothetical protein
VKQSLFDFGTDPALDEAGHGEAGMDEPAPPPAESEPTSRKSASAGSVVESAQSASSAFGSPVPARTVRADMPSDTMEAGERSPWREVPQALFLSWSPARQYAYCAARDEDSARCAYTDAEAEWFRQRARDYKEIQWQAQF